MRSDKFGSQLDRESKTWLFTFLNVYVSWIEWDKILILQFLPPKFKYFADQNRSKGGSHENEFWEFSDTKINITDSKSSKSGWKKNGVVCLVSFFPSWVMVVKLQKIVHFLQIYTDLSKKSKFIKAIFISTLTTSSCSFGKYYVLYGSEQQLTRYRGLNYKKSTD